MSRALFIAVLGLGLGGCAVWSALRDPGSSTAQVAALSVETGAAQGTLTFELTVPGGGSRSLREARWELWLRGRRFASGVVTSGAVTVEGSQTRVRIVSPLSLPQGSAPPPGLAQAGLTGNVTLSEDGADRTWGFDHRALISVERAGGR